MSEYLLSVKEIKKILGMTNQGITWNLREGNIEGAFKSGNKWLVPEDKFVDWVLKTNREVNL